MSGNFWWKWLEQLTNLMPVTFIISLKQHKKIVRIKWTCYVLSPNKHQQFLCKTLISLSFRRQTANFFRTFKGLPKFKDNNQIEYIFDYDMFNYCVSLKIISQSDNKIIRIGTDVLIKLRNLRKINLKVYSEICGGKLFGNYTIE